MKGSGMDMAFGARELKHRIPDFGIRVRILGLISDALLTWYDFNFEWRLYYSAEFWLNDGKKRWRN
jgi:hypothetical protein